MRSRLSRFDTRRLRRYLGGFFLALLIPSALLVWQAMEQLQSQSFYRYRALAEELAVRIDRHFQELTDKEEARGFATYAFLMVSGDPKANFLQRSPLSNLPAQAAFPGLVGYFQIDSDGRLSSPVLPEPPSSAVRYGISTAEIRERSGLQHRIFQILHDNHLASGRTRLQPPAAADTEAEVQADTAVSAATRPLPQTLKPASEETLDSESEVIGQSLFDRLQSLKTTSVEKKQPGRLAAPATTRAAANPQAAFRKIPQTEARAQRPNSRGKRKERTSLPVIAEQPLDRAEGQASSPQQEARIRTFESEIDPFEFSWLDSGHLVLYRKVWRNGQRYIQGALIEQQPFFAQLVRPAFDATLLSGFCNLSVDYRNRTIVQFYGRGESGSERSINAERESPLYQTRLQAPFNDLQLRFSLNRVPPTGETPVVIWSGAILLIVLCAGTLIIYRLGVSQIELARQQQDFVSAVSHELKTPLTSIRMYGEMLRQGWTPEARKMTYYNYIYSESERLSRLINNVLQLARMTRNEHRPEAVAMRVEDALNAVRASLVSLCESASFELGIHCADDAADSLIRLDRDSWIQIMINLVDNAIKFSAGSGTRKIELKADRPGGNVVLFRIRDFGPGIAPGQMKKIFRLFYRSENELTRETTGTGIGLALVHQLATEMNARVDVVNRKPGAEFRIEFPIEPSGG